jgi:hypothetical protein
MLPPELAMWYPARLVMLCLMTSWFCRGSIGARLLLSRRFGSSKAGPKQQQQPDFQADVSAGCWKVVTAGDLRGSTPTMYLVSSSSGSSNNRSAADAEGASSSDGDADDASGTKLSRSPAGDLKQGSSGNSAEAGQVQQGDNEVLTLVHRKPRGSKGVLLQLKPLTGYDVRHSVQKCAVQCGIKLAVSAQLASHSTEEALKYAANSCYEAAASTGAPLKLVSSVNSCVCVLVTWCSQLQRVVILCRAAAILAVRNQHNPKHTAVSFGCAVLTGHFLFLCLCAQASPEWREGQPPAELQPGSSIAGVPLDLDLLG